MLVRVLAMSLWLCVCVCVCVSVSVCLSVTRQYCIETVVLPQAILSIQAFLVHEKIGVT